MAEVVSEVRIEVDEARAKGWRLLLPTGLSSWSRDGPIFGCGWELRS